MVIKGCHGLELLNQWLNQSTTHGTTWAVASTNHDELKPSGVAGASQELSKP